LSRNEEGLEIKLGVFLNYSEIHFDAIRAQGAGGQNVNKVSSAIHLRFNVSASSLPQYCKDRLLALRDKRLTKDGVLIIKAQRHRTQDLNKDDAIARLAQVIRDASTHVVRRIPTKPTKGSKRRRIESKVKRGQLKQTRSRLPLD
jgi:ribosome-associated protein